MPLRERYARNPIASAKLASALFIILFYIIYSQLNPPVLTVGQPLPKRPTIQYDRWDNGTGKVDEHRRDQVREAMRYAWTAYTQRAWGADGIRPVSGLGEHEATNWGAFVMESGTTLAVMREWVPLVKGIDYMVEKVDFAGTFEDVNFRESTVRYLGALVSLVELGDAGVIPNSVLTATRRAKFIKIAVELGTKLLGAFDRKTGLPWPRINFMTGQLPADNNGDMSTSLANIGTNLLELCALSKLAKDAAYCAFATLGWATLVIDPYIEELPGLVNGPISIHNAAPTNTERSWDTGHGGYYEYLLKGHLLLPNTRDGNLYRDRWLAAAEALKTNLTSRSSYSEDHLKSHLYLGNWIGPWYINQMDQTACFAPGNLLLGGSHLEREDLVKYGQSLLEGCRHLHSSTPTGLSATTISWDPAPGTHNGTFEPVAERQLDEFDKYGYWIVDPVYTLRPEYAESLFYAFRITGEKRYRDWAWELFEAIQTHCKTSFGFAGIEDVTAEGYQVTWIDEAQNQFLASTLKYLYLIFEDVNVISLDDWIFTNGGHLVRRGR